MLMRLSRKLLSVVVGGIIMVLTGCLGSSDVKDAVDVAKGVPRKTIDVSRLGMNAFVNDGRFGSIADQFAEVKGTLGIDRVRVLMAWDDGVQSGPDAEINFGFYDEVASSIPGGMQAVVVLTHLPSWMSDSANWIDGNPRKTFVEKFVKPVVRRYNKNNRIVGFQIWNEPNDVNNPDNLTMQLAASPENYVELLASAYSVMRDRSPGKLVVTAATTAINQNYPETRDYNRGMRDAGAAQFADVWAIHWYGRQYENLIRKSGIAEFLGGLGLRVWVTESGAQGVTEQLAFGEQTWPFLLEKAPNIEYIFVYQFTESASADKTYGLRTLDKSKPYSDLYISLRDRNR
jgi:hypothetical protein